MELCGRTGGLCLGHLVLMHLSLGHLTMMERAENDKDGTSFD